MLRFWDMKAQIPPGLSTLYFSRVYLCINPGCIPSSTDCTLSSTERTLSCWLYSEFNWVYSEFNHMYYEFNQVYSEFNWVYSEFNWAQDKLGIHSNYPNLHSKCIRDIIFTPSSCGVEGPGGIHIYFYVYKTSIHKEYEHVYLICGSELTAGIDES
jgi:hypothetical protein